MKPPVPGIPNGVVGQGTPRTTLNNQGISKAMGCSQQSDGKSLLLKRNLFNSVNIEKLTWCLPRIFTILTCVHGAGKYFAHGQRRKVNFNPATNPLDLQWKSACMVLWCNSGTNVVSNQPILG